MGCWLSFPPSQVGVSGRKVTCKSFFCRSFAVFWFASSRFKLWTFLDFEPIIWLYSTLLCMFSHRAKYGLVATTGSSLNGSREAMTCPGARRARDWGFADMGFLKRTAVFERTRHFNISWLFMIIFHFKRFFQKHMMIRLSRVFGSSLGVFW